MLNDLLLPISSFLISKIIRSYRYEAYNDSFINSNKNRPPVFALFHSVQMLVASYKTPFKTNILVSLSKDGDIAAEALKALGFGIVRGSSSKRGREGLKELISLVNSGESAVITVDGPRGPYEEVKGGIIRLSQLCGVPVVCVSAASRPMYRLTKSWDNFILAPPFSKVYIYFSDPIYIEKDLNKDGFERYKHIIKKELALLHKKCLKMAQGN